MHLCHCDFDTDALFEFDRQPYTRPGRVTTGAGYAAREISRELPILAWYRLQVRFQVFTLPLYCDGSIVRQSFVGSRMFAVLGITGKVGGAVGRSLLAAGQQVRAIVRSQEKGDVWAERGCEVCVADMDDPQSLVTAFGVAKGVFVMLPSNFDQADGFPETVSMVKSIRYSLFAIRYSLFAIRYSLFAIRSRRRAPRGWSVCRRSVRR